MPFSTVFAQLEVYQEKFCSGTKDPLTTARRSAADSESLGN